METVFYHGTIEEYGTEIYNGEPFHFSDGEKHLLGKGVYLYKDPKHALVWARMKAKSEGSKPMILRVTVDVNEEDYLDLDSRDGQDFFFEQRDVFLALTKDKGITYIKNYYTDSHFCDFLVQRTSDTMLSKTFVYIHPRDRAKIPVRHTNQKQTDRNITRHFRTEKQYCLKDLDLITNVDIFEF
ncbi:MAG TPA: hypothetical protein VNS08_17190 [Ureibacillus sp.]|nr:hypothetical protein [Ureibacillus sp.]